MIDLSKVAKGTKVKLKDGTTQLVHGLYLSSDGPVLMCKSNPAIIAGRNVPIQDVIEIIEEK